MHRRWALVRRPSPNLAEGIVTHIERAQRVDPGLALRQWQEYCEAFRRRGWELFEAPAMDECPDAVFVEDQVVVRGDVALLGRSGAPERRPEQRGLRTLLEGLGYRCIEVTAPGSLDGGDVLKHGNDVWVGRGGRTNDSGIEQLRAAFGSQRVSVRPVPVEHVLHLKSGTTLLPDGTALVHPDAPVQAPPGVSTLQVPDVEGVAVVVLDGTTVLMSAAAPQTANLLRERGLHVVTVDISEFEKLEGCVTCLSVRLRG